MTEQTQQSSLLGKIAAYTEIWSKDPSSTIFVSLSEAYRKMGMLDDAKEVVSKGLVNHPDFPPAHIVLARIHCQQGDYLESDNSFQRALDRDPDSLAALVGYARLKILLGQESRARDLLLEARNQSPADSVINKLLLSLPAEPEPVPETQDLCSEDETPAAELTSPSPLASVTLAELYLKQGLEAEALQMYRQLSAQKPTDLMLRRQIRNLEERLAGSVNNSEDNVTDKNVVAPAKALLDTDFQAVTEDVKVETPTEDDETLVDVATLSDSIAIGTETTSISGPNTVLETLNCWLDNIQRRRGDV